MKKSKRRIKSKSRRKMKMNNQSNLSLREKLKQLNEYVKSLYTKKYEKEEDEDDIQEKIYDYLEQNGKNLSVEQKMEILKHLYENDEPILRSKL